MYGFFMALMSLRVEFNCEENQKTQKLYTYTYSNIYVIIYDYDNIEEKKIKKNIPNPHIVIVWGRMIFKVQ